MSFELFFVCARGWTHACVRLYSVCVQTSVFVVCVPNQKSQEPHFNFQIFN